MNSLRSRLILAAASLTFAAAAVSSGIAQPAPETPKPSAYKNLKVLPATMPRDQLIGVMRGFTQALGVKCTHCHVGEDGKRETMDFPSDAKKEKLIARAMLQMTEHINRDEFTVTDMSKAKVTCFTCHRGSTKPLTAPPPPIG